MGLLPGKAAIGRCHICMIVTFKKICYGVKQKIVFVKTLEPL